MIEIDGVHLEEMLPHRNGMLLVDDIIIVGDDFAVTETVMTPSCPTADENGVSPLIMVELAAQTAGVCNGLSKIKEEGKDASRKGWLVGIKRAQFFASDFLPLGSRLVVRSENRHEFDMLLEIFCVVHCEDELLAEITLQLIQA